MFLPYPVSSQQLAIRQEWEVLPRDTVGTGAIALSPDDNRFSPQEPHYLGLHYDRYAGQFRLSQFVGAVWLAPGLPLIVRPKLPQVDALRMFIEACRFPESSDHAASSFAVYPDEPSITGQPLLHLTIFQIAVYLRELAAFCTRHLRHDFVRIHENLTARVKGRVLPERNLRINTVRGRLDWLYCQYQVMSLDTPANQILKYALFLSMRYLAGYAPARELNLLWHYASTGDTALRGVELRQVRDHNFVGIRYSGLMQKYRRPHALARMIIRRLRANEDGSVRENEAETAPFALDMNRFFEAYVGSRFLVRSQ